MDQQLLESLVCPVCRGALVMDQPTVAEPRATLSCPVDRLRYPIDAGIPVLLVSHAQAGGDRAGNHDVPA